MMRWLVVVALVLLSAGCNCGTQPSADASVDAGPLDAGRDAGPLDAGRRDAGVDAGADAGPVELTVTAVLPPRGPSAGGTSVLLQGTGFLHDFSTTGSVAKPLTSIKFGSNPVLDFQIIDDETIELRTPTGVTGSVSVSVVNPNGAFSCTKCFAYYDELVVSTTTPTRGSIRGGTELTLTGSGFTPETQVLVGAYSSPLITFVSATELKVLTPRGEAPGPVDLVVYDKNGVSTRRRAFTYDSVLFASEVTPVSGALAGGTLVTLNGTGLSSVSTVQFGTTAASIVSASETQLTVVAPAASASGAVDVHLSSSTSSFTVKRGFTYFDTTGAFAVYAVSPHVVREGAVVTLTGQALDTTEFSVSFGGVAVPVTARTFSTARLTVPARGVSARVADVVVSAGTDTTLTHAVTWGMGSVTLTPATGPASGGTAVSGMGVSLAPTVDAWLGSTSVAVTTSAETSLAFTTSTGAAGKASTLELVDTSDAENRLVVGDAFTFLEPLAMGRVQPARGALAGGTLVTVFGSGFGDATVVTFGSARAKDVKVIDSHTLTCRTPKANVGVVDVAVQRLSEHDTLVGGFSYFDPRSIAGGLSGGPLTGTLNVTVLDSTYGNYGAPVSLVTVMLGTDSATPFQGVTDARGQITFSDPSLVKAQTVTAFMTGFQSVTVTSVNAENLTVFISRTSGGDGEPGVGPPGPPASVITGRVTGFKSPRPLASGESLEARVFVAQSSLFSGPPFGGAAYKPQDTWRLTEDGEGYLVLTGAGLRAVYAVLGIVSAVGDSFTPVTMGVARGIATSPDNPATNVDIVLDMQLDQTVGVSIDSPVSFPADGGSVPAQNYLYAWLDLGAEGFIPNPNNWNTGLSAASSISSSKTSLSMPHFPQLDGSNFIFLDAAQSLTYYPQSYFFRRQPGPLSNGVTIGPMLPAPRLALPTDAGFDGTLSWSLDPGGVPDIQHVMLMQQTLFGNLTVWDIVLPGTETQVVLPPTALARLRAEAQGSSFMVFMYSSRAPKFVYNQWTYDSLSIVSWSAYTAVLSPPFTLK